MLHTILQLTLSLNVTCRSFPICTQTCIYFSTMGEHSILKMHRALFTQPLLSNIWVISNFGIAPQQESPNPSPSVTHLPNLATKLHTSMRWFSFSHTPHCALLYTTNTCWLRADGPHQRGWPPPHLGPIPPRPWPRSTTKPSSPWALVCPPGKVGMMLPAPPPVKCWKNPWYIPRKAVSLGGNEPSRCARWDSCRLS